MIQIPNLTLSPGEPEEKLWEQAAGVLKVSPDSFSRRSILRQSIDARRKPAVRLVFTVGVSLPAEEGLALPAGASRVFPRSYQFPQVRRRGALPPVVVGMGPAGLFCALALARAGMPCLILERGQPVEARAAQVERFWSGGPLNPESNVQFGEGGAGAFSDGKLTTGIHDPRVSAVLETLAAAGAPEDILWQHKPHIGTDLLRRVVAALRRELLERGCEIRFGHRLTGLETERGRVAGFSAAGPQGAYTQRCDAVVLAPGHSARDTFEMLFALGVPLNQKPFAVGVRIEHRQTDISQAQYGGAWTKLPPADYKLACHLPGGRSVFSFCVCPGGQVVAAASEPGRLVTNGMSRRARDGANINGALLVGVTPADFGGSHPLAGVAFQRLWEERAFRLGGGDYRAPVQTVASLLGRPAPRGPGAPPDRPGVRPAGWGGGRPPIARAPF
ncbi:MAG: FAD-dependent oxidoreductase, partial [Oscillospiraceae bacterium]|nr:FAD-dependent oxidoreductase [Oscillospiraceae bacterium]